LSLFSFRCKEFGSNPNNGQSIFERSAQLEIDSAELLAIDYNSIHNLAKDAIHMVEGLDASLRSLECALRYHSEMEKLQKDDPAIWEAIHRSLHYRREMFHSTRLRMLSVDQRLKNIINMVGYSNYFSFCQILKFLGLQHWNYA
jgi:hypothetical protein